ncbi:hypothetical protein [Endozoicomonas sp. 4G]|uniref:hypothetical protein n=1 Tax=Endozoicomonas sp. 4G TaxID=2872754 RepID=UPI0020787937|nr:hypothetical protein [Endozoicomonas sp. 4G]
MLLKKPLILTLAVVFSVHCSKGHAQENSMSLLFALAVGKALINIPKPFIDVLSAKGEESEAIEWYHFDIPRVCFDDDILLKPDTRYGFLPATGVSPDSGVEANACSRAASDEGSDPEDSGTPDENSDNRSEEDETNTETGVQCVNTTPDPFQALNEISEYCATLRLEMINQESTSDSKIATGSEATHLPADQRPRAHQCDHKGCNYSTYRACDLKKHKQIHLPVGERLKVHRCDHEGCNYSTDNSGRLNKHKQTHLPADQRLKVHRCDHEGCNYSSDQVSHLKSHKQIHLPADQRPKVHQCDHEGCDYSAYRPGDLKKHKQTHLPTYLRPKRPKVHQCDHEGCDYSTAQLGHLKMHKLAHLPADQRPRVHQCDHEGCNYRSDRAGHLKKHKQTHLPADQRTRRLKRKAHDQPPSNKKRKKGDNE